MKSSYNSNITFGDLIATITFISNPKKIVEFGILEGYSLKKFIDNSNNECLIEAYDLFNDFNGNHSSLNIIEKFGQYKNVKIEKANFYEKLLDFNDYSIDILHIDIANNGDVYDFIFKNGISKIVKGGYIILEGGSEERDNIDWMIKFNKPKIKPILEKYSTKYNIFTIQSFPSLTIIKL